jgi:MoxR-like ATPase
VDVAVPNPQTEAATIAPVEPVISAASEPERFERAAAISDRLVDNIETVVYGKRSEIKLVLTALACDGHVLLEDVPGTAKTVLARAIAGSIEGAIPQRIQCTPDLQPTDVTGLSVFDQRTREFEFRPGPIFANVVLVDEINRATPKTQSALLEAMAERQVTVDGVTRELPYPFLLLATENPIEYEGTFPLPEAQLDRFFLRTALGYPGVEDELRILSEQRFTHPLDELRPVVALEEIQELRAAAQHVYVDDVLHRWVVELVRATRDQESVVIGSSVRGSLALERAARAWALLDGRSYVNPQQNARLFARVLVHRVVFTPGFAARAGATGWAEAIEEFRQSCLELAPQPGSEEDSLFEDGVRPAGPDSSAGANSASAESAPREPLKPDASRRDRGEHTTSP